MDVFVHINELRRYNIEQLRVGTTLGARSPFSLDPIFEGEILQITPGVSLLCFSSASVFLLLSPPPTFFPSPNGL